MLYWPESSFPFFPTTSYGNNPNELFGQPNITMKYKHYLFLFIGKCLANGKCSMNTF